MFGSFVISNRSTPADFLLAVAEINMLEVSLIMLALCLMISNPFYA